MSGVLALLVLGMVGSAASAASSVTPPARVVQTDEDVVVQIESALLQTTFACLVETNSVPEGTDPAVVVGGIDADGTAVAPSAPDSATSNCSTQAAAMVHEVVTTNAADAGEGAIEAGELAVSATEGEVVFQEALV